MKRIVFILMAAIIGMSAWANTESFLNFVKKDGKVTQFVASGTKLTFSNKTINVNSNGTTSVVSMLDLHHLEFGHSALPDGVKGDVNGDGVVDVADVNVLINIVLGLTQPSDYPNANVNGDSAVDVSDINEVISILVS